MDFSYTETQDMIRETLSRFLADTYDFDSRSKMIASSSGAVRCSSGNAACVASRFSSNSSSEWIWAISCTRAATP